MKRLTAALGAVAVTATMAASLLGQTPAIADEPNSKDWGTIVPGNCSQSESWVVGLDGLGGYVGARLFGAHAPAIPGAPSDATGSAGGQNLVNLTLGGKNGAPAVGLGTVSALYSRSMINKVPADLGSPATLPAPLCSAYAESGAASIEVGLPYVSGTKTNPVQRSPLGIHAKGIAVTAKAEPGKAVKFSGQVAGAYISTFGNKIIDIPIEWPTNLGIRIPADYGLPVFALATTNEQVTTDNKGQPTLDAKGHYKYNPLATSGYVTGIHASVLGSMLADATVVHAAVARDPKATPGPVTPSPSPGADCECTS